jgi:hypothetical protein
MPMICKYHAGGGFPQGFPCGARRAPTRASYRTGTLGRVKIDAQIAAIRASQGARAIEQQMLGEAFAGPPVPTTSLRAVGWPRDPAPTSNPTWCLPAAFFDSLIAQQDRHDGSWRWDGERLTLIDHGYAFALPRAILNYSDFVVARHRYGAASLLAGERDALTRMLSDPDLLGMAGFLPPDRAQALADRARLMLRRGEVLRPGEF